MDGEVGQAAEETSFIKVVAPAFSGSHRVLLIAQSQFAGPIAADAARAMGLDVDVYDENHLDEMGRDLVDGPALRAKYDAIWLGSFDALGKVLPPESGRAIDEAVKAGCGFIHTGGEGSFHGGQGHAAVIEATALDEVLPVEIAGRGDLDYGQHGMDDGLPRENAIHEIAAGSDAAGPEYLAVSVELLRHFG